MKLHTCENCGKRFRPGEHRRYCSTACVQSHDRKRRRARRQRRKQPAVTLCQCFDCEVTFTPDQDTLAEHQDCFWLVIQSANPCRECKTGEAVVDGLFCSEACFVKHWNRAVPHDPKRPLSAADIVWTETFAETLIPPRG